MSKCACAIEDLRAPTLIVKQWRLSEEAYIEWQRLWWNCNVVAYKCIGAIPIASIDSEYVCAIHFTADGADSFELSVTGLLKRALELELEHVVSECELMGAVVVASGLNAHLRVGLEVFG